MKVDGKDIRPIWFDKDSETVKVIDQRALPHEFVVAELKTVDDVITAIKEMYVRGAPLIGVTGAYGVYIATLHSETDDELASECRRLKSARPTAVNLAWAVDKVLSEILSKVPEKRTDAAREEAAKIAEWEAENCRKIGEYGVGLIREISQKKEGQTVNLLTHCNAGWLACIEYGTATAPMYAAYENGIDIHVWVDETRPRNQGASLTMWELMAHGVPCTLVADNVGGHLMQRGMVDLCLVGTDRTTRRGDVANKIGTYLKALAARDNGVPFYVAAPASSIDWSLDDGVTGIEIEQRSPDEVTRVIGRSDGRIQAVDIAPAGAKAANVAFDVTPACLVTALVTDRGVCPASREGLISRFPERA